ncbi:phosphate acyltransferase, partial [Candidatus Kryptonium thompsonii]|uniref:phosphate acyltransferase n=1 Tax=Candidatus Kryptonium thompsonii TaxID=1633631 RepID=UPI0007084F80
MAIGITFLEKIKEKAKQLKKHIVLPDALDERTLKAARIITDEKIANVTLIGDEEKIYSENFFESEIYKVESEKLE